MRKATSPQPTIPSAIVTNVLLSVICRTRESQYWYASRAHTTLARSIEMAAHPVANRDVDRAGHHLTADRHHMWTTGGEGTTGRRLDQRRHLASCLDPGPLRARVRYGREQQLRVGMGGSRNQLLARRALDHPAGVHDVGAIADVPGAGEVVRDVEVGETALVLESLHQVQDAHPDRDIEHRNRLIGQEQLRIGRQGPGDRDALALPARELVRELGRVGRGRLQSDGLEQLVHRVPRLAAAVGLLVDLERPGQVVADRVDRVERAEGVLEDHLDLAAVMQRWPPRFLRENIDAVEADLAGGWLDQAGDQARGRALAAAGFADDRDHLAPMDAERDVLECVQVDRAGTGRRSGTAC